jgi:hypothetical protein
MTRIFPNRSGIASMGIRMILTLGITAPWAAVFEGTLQPMVHCDIDGTVKYFHELDVGDEKRVRLEYETPDNRILNSGESIRPGFDDMRRKVKVEGTLRGNRIYVNRLEESSRSILMAPPLPEAEAPVNGMVEKTALQLVIWVGGKGLERDAAHNSVFGATGRTTNSFYAEASYGTYKLVGIKDKGGDTHRADAASCGDAETIARNSAVKAGFPVDQYDVVVYSFPAGTCGSGGVAGGKQARLYVGITELWDYATHEIAHCDVVGGGLGHASSSTNCTSLSGNTVTMGGACGHDEYGDQSDIMGGRNFQFCSWHLERAGWLPQGNRLDVSRSTRVTLLPINKQASGVQSVMIPRGTNQWFHLEFRRALGVDQNIGTGLTDGILIRTVGNPRNRSNPHILDMSPGNNFRDAALRKGNTFRSAQDNLAVTVVEVTEGHAVVDIVINGGAVFINDGSRTENTFAFTVPGSRGQVRLPSAFGGILESVEILSADGRSLRRIPAAGFAGSAATALSPGMYTLKFTGAGQSVSRRALIPR